MTTSSHRSNVRPVAGNKARLGKTVRSDNLKRPDAGTVAVAKSARTLLSAAELDALLNPNLSDLPDKTPAKDAALPDLDADRQRHQTLQRGGETLAARLSLTLQADAGLEIAIRAGSVDERPFRSVVEQMREAVAFVVFVGVENSVTGVLGLGAQLATSLIETATGAAHRFSDVVQPRALTDLDRSVLSALFQTIAPAFNAQQVRIDHRLLTAAAVAPPADGARLQLTVCLGDRAWPALLATRSEILDGLSPVGGCEARDPIVQRDTLTTLLTARLARLSVPVSRIAALKPGQTLLLGLPVDQPVELLSGGRDGTSAATADLGRAGAFMAVRLRLTASKSS